MKLFTLFTRFSVAAALAGAGAFAQTPAAGKTAAGMNAAMIRFFGNNTNFVSRADIRVLDKSQKETTSMTVGFQMLAGKMRLDLNLAEVKSIEMSPEFAATLKQVGVDQMASILLTDQKKIITIYPRVKSYTDNPMPKEELDAAAMTYKQDKTKIGKETIDGHPCEKDNVTLTDTTGAKQHAVVWYASDLKDFPVQIQIPDEDSTLIMKFKDVKLGRPELSQFEVPAGLAKYDDTTTLMSDAVAKKMGVGAAK